MPLRNRWRRWVARFEQIEPAWKALQTVGSQRDWQNRLVTSPCVTSCTHTLRRHLIRFEHREFAESAVRVWHKFDGCIKRAKKLTIIIPYRTPVEPFAGQPTRQTQHFGPTPKSPAKDKPLTLRPTTSKVDRAVTTRKHVTFHFHTFHRRSEECLTATLGWGALICFCFFFAWVHNTSQEGEKRPFTTALRSEVERFGRSRVENLTTT